MKCRNRKEEGSALIAVLCLIFTAGLLTTSVLSLSRTGTFTVEAHVKQQRSRYVAEGAAHRIQWLIAADRTLYPDATPENIDYDEYEFDRYLADGVVHTLDYYGELLQFTIHDAVSGYDLSPSGYADTLTLLASAEDAEQDLIENVATLKSRIADYVDSDDTIAADDSMETGEYEEQGSWPLPRNAEPEYKEELLWIPGFAELFPPDREGRLSSVRLIPPANTVTLSGTPSLFAASAEQIKLVAQLEDAELAEVLSALKTHQKEREPLSELLEEELLQKLSGFSQKESGYYTIRIDASPQARRPFRRLEFSFSGFGITGPDNQNLTYLQWVCY